MIREIATRFGRENIGFLWIMVEPLLFACLVAVMWHFMTGVEAHGISVITFTISGYIPLVFFRSSVSRAVLLFKTNASLMYHRQIKIYDFVFVRFCLEFIGHLMAYFFISIALYAIGVFPEPYDIGFLLLGWLYYSYFVLAVSFIMAPLSELSDTIEKLTPVVTYLSIPFSGTFNMVSWVTPSAREVLLYSPPVHGMEMMRLGIFGPSIAVYYEYFYPLITCSAILVVGLFLCKRIRKNLVVE